MAHRYYRARATHQLHPRLSHEMTSAADDDQKWLTIEYRLISVHRHPRCTRIMRLATFFAIPQFVDVGVNMISQALVTNKLVTIPWTFHVQHLSSSFSSLKYIP